MKGNFKQKIVPASATFLWLFLLMAGPASADLVVLDGSSFSVPLNDGALITNSAVHQRTTLLSLTGDTFGSAQVSLSSIPLFTKSDGSQYFWFIYDTQETQNKRDVRIEDVAITVGDYSIWDLAADKAIVLNTSTDSTKFTLTSLSQGGDLELFIPVTSFYGKGLTGSSLLTFYSQVSQNNNGPEEWFMDQTLGTRFGPTDPIDPVVPVPAPAAALLGLLGLGYAGMKVRRFV